MNNLRIIAKSDNNYLVTDEENISLEDTEKEVFLIDKFGRRITSKIPIYRFFREDYNWEPMNKNYEDEILKKSSEEMISDALIGFAIGDAFGVPYEFLYRKDIEKLPIKDMVGNNTKEKINSRWGDLIPAGAWSDDTSMTIATMASFIRNDGKFDSDDIMKSFLAWWGEGKYSSLNKPFGLGGVVYKALESYTRGVPAEECGPKEFKDNGNGSLMRILPYSLYCIENNLSFDETCDIISKGSALTHGNDISKICCCIYTEYLRNCVETQNPVLSFDMLSKLDYSSKFNKDAVEIGKEITATSFKFKNIEYLKEKNGYVVETLKAVFYSLLNGTNFETSIIQAVKIGYDTDTIAGITGAAAGIIYGLDDVPKNWTDTLLKKEQLEELANKFSECLIKKKEDNFGRTK